MGDSVMDDIDFDSGLRQLEQIVQRLESGDLTLEESLKVFEEGIGLVRHLTRKLDEAEKRIEILTQSEDGSIRIEDFEPRGKGQ
jgi:exodeoxyribonuclease VII small subunit